MKKKKMLTIALSSSALLAGLAGTAWADSFTADASYAVGPASNSASDSTDPASASVNSGSVSWFDGFNNQASGFASGEASSSEANGVASESHARADYGSYTGTQGVEAQATATWEKTFLAPADGTYSWDSFFPGAYLEVYDEYGGGTYAGEADFSSLLKVDGVEKENFSASVDLTNGLTTNMATPDGSGSFQNYEWAGWSPFTFSTDVGHKNENDPITIYFEAYTHAIAPAPGTQLLTQWGEGLAYIGDPGQFFFDGELSYIPDPAVQPIPEPATFLLLGTGLAGLAGARRRKKRLE